MLSKAKNKSASSVLEISYSLIKKARWIVQGLFRYLANQYIVKGNILVK